LYWISDIAGCHRCETKYPLNFGWISSLRHFRPFGLLAKRPEVETLADPAHSDRDRDHFTGRCRTATAEDAATALTTPPLEESPPPAASKTGGSRFEQVMDHAASCRGIVSSHV